MAASHSNSSASSDIAFPTETPDGSQFILFKLFTFGLPKTSAA